MTIAAILSVSLLRVVKLSLVMLRVVMLDVGMLRDVILSIFMLRVCAYCRNADCRYSACQLARGRYA
jgi:hypothetical protein